MAKGTNEQGWGLLPCPCCGEEVVIVLDLETLASFYCRHCKCRFERDVVEAFRDRWGEVLAWIDRMSSGPPADQDAPACEKDPKE